MKDLWRWAVIQMGGMYVVLIDQDGEHNVRRVYWEGGEPFAARWPWGIRTVKLLDGGALGPGSSYVEKWAPYTPFARRKIPKAGE